MEIIGMLLSAIGVVAMLVGGIWFLIETFKTSVLWGLGCLFVPFVSLIWLIMHWQQGGRPFLLQLAGIGVTFAGVALGGF